METSVVTRWQSPLGEILIAAKGNTVSGLWFSKQKYYPPEGFGMEDENNPVLEQLKLQLHEYFEGKRRVFSLTTDPGGTPFQKEVWEQLCRIPYGGKISYGQLAKQLGNPGMARAVGAAVGRNPISLIIPCHRVVGANGSLTGYAGGVERKAALLQLEANVLREQDNMLSRL